MKILTIAAIATLAILMSALVTLSAQNTVVGHVSAEIVEAASVSSNSVISHTISSQSPEQADLSLGNISVKSSNSASYDVVIKPATVSTENGNSFKVSPTAENQYISQATATNGNRTLALRGNVDFSNTPAAGEYKGSYTVIFAYN
ncbi:hypothetical protein BRDCF_p2130 [Bacteroidales bacterium CF]|jgi:hypothetical protein|nr:hypothetical protein BRDCF_p2130 [Bacteroidales bacterium CF]